MRTILAMLFYLGGAAALAAGLGASASWLTRADATAASPQRTPIIPPRIAESIERKKAVLPEPPKEVSVMRPVSQPAMNVAPVALIQTAPKVRMRERPAALSKRATRKPRRQEAIEPPHVASFAAPLPTARTDFPY
jgi:hypothetical protein